MKNSTPLSAHCTTCGHDNWEPHLEVPNRSSPDSYSLVVRCNGCGILRLSPGAEISAGNMKVHTFNPHYTSTANRGLTEHASARLGPLTRRWKSQMLASHFESPGPLLEVGCGTGELMSVLVQKGFDVVGIEPGKQARLHAQRHHGLNVLADLDQAPHSFSGAILWHVLEHVEDPVAFLTKIRSRLTSEGLLVVAVPNAASRDATLYGSRWVAWHAPHHRWHFEPPTLDRVLKEAGFKTQIRASVPSDTLFNCAASEIFHSSGLRWTLPVRLTRAVWRTVTILFTVKRFGPSLASTLLVVARPATPKAG